MYRVGIKDGNDGHSQSVIYNCQQQQEVDGAMTGAKNDQGAHPRQRDVRSCWHTPALNIVLELARDGISFGGKPSVCAACGCRRHARVSIERVGCIQEIYHHDVDQNRTHDTTERCHQWVRCSSQGIQRATRQQSLCNLFNRKPEEETHENIVDEEVQVNGVAENLPDPDGTSGDLQVTGFVRIYPGHSRQYTRNQGHRILLHQRHCPRKVGVRYGRLQLVVEASTIVGVRLCDPLELVLLPFPALRLLHRHLACIPGSGAHVVHVRVRQQHKVVEPVVKGRYKGRDIPRIGQVQHEVLVDCQSGQRIAHHRQLLGQVLWSYQHN
mmetsp:Transcript_44611/g.72334  ORF Transcript_44611/g.72334 Transcript_44611/m.72334 type:complete len:325 (-) Transcript_44611:643-1617(-)